MKTVEIGVAVKLQNYLYRIDETIRIGDGANPTPIPDL
jgi:hypothetical protein